MSTGRRLWVSADSHAHECNPQSLLVFPSGLAETQKYSVTNLMTVVYTLAKNNQIFTKTRISFDTVTLSCPIFPEMWADALCSWRGKGGGQAKKQGWHCLFGRLHHHGNWSNPCPVSQAKPVTRGTNEEVGCYFGQLWFTNPHSDSQQLSHQLLSWTEPSPPMPPQYILL